VEQGARGAERVQVEAAVALGERFP